MHSSRLFVLISLCGLFLLGCGGPSEPGRHAIQGVASVNGTNIAKGSISFFPAQGVSGRPVTTVIEAGEYHFTRENGPFAGEHRVVIGIEIEPISTVETASAGVSTGLSSGIKVAPPPEDARRRRPGTPKITPPKTQWEIQCTIEENGDDQKDFVLSG
ncbi:MAG: hypothetical protein H6822_36430 [Planctomycetaceae bacterium]|nr:hypothetical protein [Planctomycetales bacterium]MCB9927675.1 hypothetical protein [Planctomycetaceae bacterium]